MTDRSDNRPVEENDLTNYVPEMDGHLFHDFILITISLAISGGLQRLCCVKNVLQRRECGKNLPPQFVDAMLTKYWSMSSRVLIHAVVDPLSHDEDM